MHETHKHQWITILNQNSSSSLIYSMVKVFMCLIFVPMKKFNGETFLSYGNKEYVSIIAAFLVKWSNTI